MKKLIKKSLPQQIADEIEERIKSGRYSIGEKLPTEPLLVEEFGVSRNTVREAVQSLTHSGLLETRQGDGTYVVAKEKLQVEIFNMMSSATYNNILEVREFLENHIVISAIKKATAPDIARIDQYLQLRKKEVNSIRENTQADLDFHIAIAQATHNDIILNMYKYVSEYIQEFISQKLHDGTKDQTYIDELHDLLFKAIKERDTEKALECVNKIIEI